VTARRAALGLLLVLAILYGAFPWLASRALPAVLARFGVESSRFVFGHPGWTGIDVASFELATGATTIAGTHARLRYGLSLLRGELESADVAQLTVHLGRETVAREPGAGPIEMPAIWTRVPARRVDIARLIVANVDPVVSATGSVSLDPEVLQVRLQVDSPLLAAPVSVAGAVNPDGRLAITLTEQGATEPFGSLIGVPDAAAHTMAFDGRIALVGQPLALAAAYARLADASGSVQLRMHARTPWPWPASGAWQTLSGDGDYHVDVTGSRAAGAQVQVRVNGDFTLADGVVKARLESAGAARLDFPEAADIAKRAALDPRVSLSNDQGVEIEYTSGGVRIGDGLIVALGGDRPLRVRARGAFGADGRFELGVAGLDGAPILLATGNPGPQQQVAVKGQLALTGKVLHLVAASAGVTETGGHLVADFEGALRWPLLPEAALQNVSGKGRVRLALTGLLGDARRFDIALEGLYTLADSIAGKIDSGAHVVLATDGVELATVSPVTFEVRGAPSRLQVDSADMKVSLRPFAVGKHTLSLNNAWLTVEKVALDGDTITAAAVIRSHAGRDALPVRVTLSHDLRSAAGEFSLGGNWQVKKPLLETQLPGFDAPYDLDEGAVTLALDGRWDLSKGFALAANGHVTVQGQRAHYEDYTISGLALDVPLRIDAGSLAIPSAAGSIDAVDVGFPLTDIGFDVALANGVARVSGLSGSILQGRFSADEFDYVLASDQSALTLQLNGISLSEMLALEGGDVHGTGVLDGRLPVTVDGDALTIADGRIVARAPGGTLAYKGASASSLVEQSGFGFAFRALEDFRYDTLDADVALAADGALKLAVRLQGANPAVEKGRPIRFNLNLAENIPALLESLRAAENAAKRVEHQLTR
jgi:hypothetical protein